MKKFLKFTLSFLALAVVGYFVYCQYQKKAVLKGLIYSDADAVIKIGLHDLKKTLVLDALSSPSYYWKNAKLSTQKKDKDTVASAEKGIDLQPYSVILYTAKDVKNTLFTSFKIDDSELFEAYAKLYFKEKNQEIYEQAYSYTSDEKAKLVFAWNSEVLVIAMSPKTSFEACKTVFDAVLVENKVISESSHPFIEGLSAVNDHITFLKGKDKVSLNFKDGEALLNGVLYTHDPNSFKNQISYTSIPGASLQLYFDFNLKEKQHQYVLKELLESSSFLEKNNLEVNTLLDKMDGNFSLAIKGTTQQMDTIITYEYDDNFEKVATKTTQVKEAPMVYLKIGSENNLNQYFQEQGALENGILKAFPLYSFYALEDSTVTEFSTIKNPTEIQRKTGSYFFNVQATFKDLQEDLKIASLYEFSEVVTELRLTAQQAAANEVILKGKLEATKNDINIISQVFFGMQAKDTF